LSYFTSPLKSIEQMPLDAVSEAMMGTSVRASPMDAST